MISYIRFSFLDADSLFMAMISLSLLLSVSALLISSSISTLGDIFESLILQLSTMKSLLCLDLAAKLLSVI